MDLRKRKKEGKREGDMDKRKGGEGREERG
jgi:hypothetical protein